MKGKSMSAKLSLIGAAVCLVTLTAFCIYGAVYDYFDSVVAIALALGTACAAVYAFVDGKATEYLNLCR